MRSLIHSVLRRLGYELTHVNANDRADGAAHADLSDAERAILARVQPYTMTGAERIAALLNAVNHLCDREVPGDIAECGVWRGGSMMAAALALIARGDTRRSLYLFDTFEGMPRPGTHDVRWDGRSAQAMFEVEAAKKEGWCRADLNEVRENMLSTGYPADRIHFIEGRVEQTIPARAPTALALLRLDTDWYESTRHELVHLYPRVSRGGIVIIDDYGYFRGARKAVDEYLRERDLKMFLHRIDSTGRLLVKNGR